LGFFVFERSVKTIERIQNYWNNRAKTYSEGINEELNSFKRDAWKKIIRDKVGDKDNIKALDIGTGPGFFAIIMSELGYDVTAVDSSISMIEEAKYNAKVAGANIRFILNDGENLNLPKEEFDLIINRNVTWLLTDPIKTYRDWHELLKEDGKLLIFDANWYIGVTRPEMKEQYKKDLALAMKNGYKYKKRVTDKQSRECEDIAKTLPLTYKKRPEWDKEVLLSCGFKKVEIDENIDHLIYSKEEQLVTRTTPTFSICSYK